MSTGKQKEVWPPWPKHEWGFWERHEDLRTVLVLLGAVGIIFLCTAIMGWPGIIVGWMLAVGLMVCVGSLTNS